ncbi:hypothetical protein [Paraburkholderia sp. BCC1885]|uniref:hypothetical protein n=1 Tax=Paraburkholderia sp. BCC1885 TaxID=2562669 RepID=UPI001182AB75|nr:hypothetical protein [Paraburkholderia sp. BCC1885]
MNRINKRDKAILRGTTCPKRLKPILAIAGEIMRVKRPKPDTGHVERVSGKASSALLAGGVGCILLLIVLALLSRYIKLIEVSPTIAFGLGVLAQLLSALSLMALLVSQAASLWSTWSGRASFALGLAEREMTVFEPFLSRLASFDQADLEYVAEHLAWQKEAFDRRRHGLAGPVEKIGIVPFVIAAVTSAPQVFNALRNVGPMPVRWGVVGVAACFYGIAWLTSPHSTKLERTAWLIKWAADQKKSTETNSITTI